MKKTLLSLNIILVVISIGALLARVVDPNVFSPFAFLGLLYPYLIILNIAFVLLWIFYHLPYSILSILLILISSNAIGGFIQFHFASKEDMRDRIHVMSYNINNAGYVYNKDVSKRKEARITLIEYFKNLDIVPDIILLQEVGAYAQDILSESFAKHQVHQVDKRGTAIFSIYPIIKKGEIDLGTNVNSCMWADLLVYNDTIRVYSIHLQSNQITSATANIVKDGNLQDEKTWSSIKWILSKYKDNNQTRSSQVQLIKEHIINSPYPVILGSDLNDPPQSFTYSQLISVLNDSYREKGMGLGTTFAGQIPLLRIDYIMTSTELEVLKHSVNKAPYSDHYPVNSTMLLKK